MKPGDTRNAQGSAEVALHRVFTRARRKVAQRSPSERAPCDRVAPSSTGSQMSAESPATTGQIAAGVLLDPERRRKLFRYACVQFRINEQDAEDLLQETALELLRYRSYVRSPEGFVFTVFRARCVRFSGSRRAAYMQSSEPSDGGAELCDAEANCIEEQLALREALNEISSKCRRLIHAYYLEGQSLKEAARTVALADSSVARTISRCLKRLRECMA